MSKTFEQRLDEAAQKWSDENSDYGTFYDNCFKAGAQYVLSNLSHVPKVKALIDKNKDLIAWLMRMSELRWEDKHHASNFKHCVESLNESIKALESE